MSDDSESNQRFLKWTRASWVGVVVSTITLFFGMMATGGGHGSYELWFCGLAFSAVTWFLILESVIVGFRGRKQGVWLPVLILQTVVFLALTCVGIWGMGG